MCAQRSGSGSLSPGTTGPAEQGRADTAGSRYSAGVLCPPHLNRIERLAGMVDLERVLDDAGLTNPYVREYVAHWAGVTGAERVEVVSAADDARLIDEALASGDLLSAGEGRYYSRSYY